MVCLRRRGRAGVRRNRDGRSRLSSDQHRDTAPRPLRRRSRRTPPLAKLLRGCRHGSCVPPPWLSRSRSVKERNRKRGVEGKSVQVREDIGGGRILKKKKT